MTVTSPRKPLVLIAVLAMVAAMVASLSLPAGAQTPEPISADTFTLTILHNSNGESKLLPDRGRRVSGCVPFRGFAMKQMQADAADSGVITLSSGDNFLASQELGVSLARGGGTLMIRWLSADCTTRSPWAITTSTLGPR